MKHLVLILLVTVLSLPAAMAADVTSVDALFDEFSSEPDAESVCLNPFCMWFAKLFVGGSDANVVKKISSVRVLDIDDCKAEVKTRFAARVAHVTVKDMEDLVNMNDSGDKVKIFARIKKDKIHKLLVMCYGTDDYCLVEINGQFGMEDVNGVVSSQMPKRNDRR